MTLRARVLLTVLAAIALALAGLTVGFNVVLANRLDTAATGVVQARASAEFAGLHVAGGRIELGETPDEAGPDTQIWVFHGARALEAPQSVPAANNAAAAAMALAQPSTRDISATRTRLYSLPVVAGARRLGTVIAGVSLAPYDQTRHTALVASAVLGLLVLVAVALASWWLISRALRPVAQMTAQAAEWSDRALNRRFSLGQPHDELTQLAFTLDRLLDRIAASLRHEQRLSAELSHELRTPLANIAAQAQFALRHTDQDENGRRVLEQVLASATQMGRTLDTLIAAARAELDPSRATTDAAAGARAAAAALGSERDVTLTISASPGIRVAGEQALVERILAPLVENAYRHAAAIVRIGVQRHAGTVAFTVEDDGPGVRDTDREVIFEPGRRAAGPSAGSRATAVASHGAGLGLALSRRLARTAGGDVEAEHSDAGGRFVVRLPAV
ncbi:MAG: HAMP domain-containing histidine kinase [Solirubrobacterales bacterium]|nr:HAMP domain-containing histidine kinase [Solirubrobacterales bacterium]